MTCAATFLLDVLGLLLGFSGTVLIYFFGVPRQTDNGGVNVLSLEGDARYDEEEIARISRFKTLGNTGLILIGMAFFLQLVSRLLAG